jgi:hypothetical protein
MNQSNYVAGQLENVICLDWLRPIGLAVATLVRSHHMEPCLSECWDLVPPGIPALWEAMAENDQGPLTLLGKVHLNAVGVDESVFYCCHRVSLEACLFVF